MNTLNLNWVTGWASTGFENALAISNDNKGNLYIGGYMNGNTYFYNTNSNVKVPFYDSPLLLNTAVRSPILLKYSIT